MNWRTIGFLGILAVPLVGMSCNSPEQAALNRRNAVIGERLATHEDPEVSTGGAEVKANADCLDATAFADAGNETPTPTTPEESAALRTIVADDYATDQSLWGVLKTGVQAVAGWIPGGEPTVAAIMLGLTTLAAWWRKRKWKKLARAGIEGVQTFRENGLLDALGKISKDPAVIGAARDAIEELLKGHLSKAHNAAGLSKMADAEVEKAKAAPEAPAE